MQFLLCLRSDWLSEVPPSPSDSPTFLTQPHTLYPTCHLGAETRYGHLWERVICWLLVSLSLTPPHDKQDIKLGPSCSLLFSPFGPHHHVRSLLGWHRPPWNLALCPGQSLLGSPPPVPTHSPSPCANRLSSCVLFISNESIKKCGVLTCCSRCVFSLLYKCVEYLHCHWTLMHRGWRGDILPHWDPWDPWNPLVPSLPLPITGCGLQLPTVGAISCLWPRALWPCSNHHPAPLLTHKTQITMRTRG